MKTISFSIPGLAVAAMLALAGCATPESRIRKNPAAFDALSPEVQEAVRQGRVELGFPTVAVELALGKPDRIYTRQTETGTQEVWSYVGYTTSLDRQRVEGRFRIKDPQGGYRTVTDSIWVDVDRRTEYEKLRVEFGGGQVRAIERTR